MDKELETAVWQRDASCAVYDAVPELLEALIWIANNGTGESKRKALSALKAAAKVPKPLSGI